MAEKKQTCLAISPIGEEGTEFRKRADQILKDAITPAAAECGFDTLRADQISELGLITPQVIRHVIDDPLPIADLSGPSCHSASIVPGYSSPSCQRWGDVVRGHSARGAYLETRFQSDCLPYKGFCASLAVGGRRTRA